MATLDISALRSQGAAAARANRPAAGRLALIYSGVLALLTLAVNSLYLLLDNQIGGTGGLDGMGLRTVLQTLQEVLTYANLLFSPFWSAGFLWAMMSMVRGRTPQAGDLMAGFRRFGRVLGYLAYQFLIVVAVSLAPVLFLPLYIWLAYGFRLALYLVMDGAAGGVQAHFLSLRLMRGYKWQLLKLDLSFWWYYALTVLAAVVGYLDVILELMGIAVPVDATVMYFATMGAYCLMQIALALWKKCPVDAAYALAYEAIAHPAPTEALVKTE